MSQDKEDSLTAWLNNIVVALGEEDISNINLLPVTVSETSTNQTVPAGDKKVRKRKETKQLPFPNIQSTDISDGLVSTNRRVSNNNKSSSKDQQQIDLLKIGKGFVQHTTWTTSSVLHGKRKETLENIRNSKKKKKETVDPHETTKICNANVARTLHQ
ncbi:predicted protein [Naegleria gruberi]|uniref:Predicted protein n=1 Tax=Naegleria gruberi TaxID=5762 RepID=D2V6W2_NAEGR|nr:uncharacterized protein NAEGRDRAFT_47141 [Naegleria gruberi]EFC47516.1 predicted protein [Naegleria gruberi]|eukprot:XP_002680260.1 predicted protein [Naegleria gruberi strain NEG-M]